MYRWLFIFPRDMAMRGCLRRVAHATRRGALCRGVQALHSEQVRILRRTFVDDRQVSAPGPCTKQDEIGSGRVLLSIMQRLVPRRLQTSGQLARCCGRRLSSMATSTTSSSSSLLSSSSTSCCRTAQAARPVRPGERIKARGSDDGRRRIETSDG